MSNERFIEERILHEAKMFSLTTLSFPFDVPAIAIHFTNDFKLIVSRIVDKLELYQGIGFYCLDNDKVFDLVNNEDKVTGCAIYLVKTSKDF